MKKLTVIFLFLICTVAFAQDTNDKKSEFEMTVEKHLKAIDNKNFEEFKSTVTELDNFNVILPNGVNLSSRQQFLDFTKAWFSETTWKMKYTILNLKETSEMGFVLLMVNYTDLNEKGEEYSLVYYLNLIFAKEFGQWRLIHDQNTMCYDKNR